jgi:hypothetical protein
MLIIHTFNVIIGASKDVDKFEPVLPSEPAVFYEFVNSLFAMSAKETMYFA